MEKIKKSFLIIGIIFFFRDAVLAQDIRSLTLADTPPYPKPWIEVPNEHPRLLMRKSDLGTIEKNMELEESKNAVREFNLLLEDRFDGNLPDLGSEKANYNGRKLAVIEARAFEYALTNDRTMGRSAISSMRNIMNTITFHKMSDDSRPIGQTIFTASQVYDWCYPLLTEDDKEFFIDKCQEFAGRMEIGWPPVRQAAVTSHAGEAQLMRDLISFAIAVYDERPEFYHWTVGRFLHEFVKPRDYWYRSFTHHQGDGYGAYRQIWDAWAQWILFRMSGTKVLHDNFRYAIRNWIYTRRPDGQLFREGDSTLENGDRKVFWGKYDPRADHRTQHHIGTAMLLVGNFYRDPVLKSEALYYNARFKDFVYSNATRTPVQFLLFNDPTIGTVSNRTLPLARYNPSPYGGIVARTGWDNSLTSNDVIAFMKIGELSGANHQHRDAGNFQIFYKGILTSESGYYRGYNSAHVLNYSNATIAHNSLLIKDPDEVFNYDNKGPFENDGGQNQIHGEAHNLEHWLSGPYDRGKVIAHEIIGNNRNLQFAYIKGDITRAYTHKVKKVNEVLRSMVFVPTGNRDFPAMFVVMDKVESTNPNFEKTFLLHCQEEPEIDKNITTIKRVKFGYNGMLINQTLLPIDAKLKMIGGQGKDITSNRFLVNETNYLPVNFEDYDEDKKEGEFGWGRIEIKPSSPRKTDYFLNTMYVKDADKTLAIQTAQLIETDDVVGLKQLNNVLMFARGANKLNNEFTFNVPGNEKKLKVIVMGVSEGRWTIKINGKSIKPINATEEGGVLLFEAPAGEYKLKNEINKN